MPNSADRVRTRFRPPEHWEAVLADPAKVAAWAERGDANFALQRYKKAIADFTGALEHDPDNPELLRARGMAHFENNANDEAVADLDAALAIAPDDAEAFAYRGASHFCMDEGGLQWGTGPGAISNAP